MTSSHNFTPDWASPPGNTIRDVLQARRLSVAEFARRMEQPAERVNDLLRGDLAITMSVARRLEKVVGASAEFWMAREGRFREGLARRQARDKQWLDELPIDDMVKYGWIAERPEEQAELAACLAFFDQPDLSACRRHYANLERLVAFRKSPTFESRPAAIAAWLRQGERVAQSIKCAPWNRAQFREALQSVRKLTRLKNPEHFLPKLQRLCADSGVAVVVVRAPDGCRASGATMFLSRNKALLLLSFRYLTDDQFWFSFFHEAGHLLLHGKHRVFLEGIETAVPAEEAEADNFAERTLVPDSMWDEMMKLRANTFAVLRFATEVGIAAGIVVGQLQHYGKIRPNELNRLKRRFRWTT
jgi:HTH-type transcriptional regulator/antitoxin HigA